MASVTHDSIECTRCNQRSSLDQVLPTTLECPKCRHANAGLAESFAIEFLMLRSQIDSLHAEQRANHARLAAYALQCGDSPIPGTTSAPNAEVQRLRSEIEDLQLENSRLRLVSLYGGGAHQAAGSQGAAPQAFSQPAAPQGGALGNNYGFYPGYGNMNMQNMQQMGYMMVPMQSGYAMSGMLPTQ